MADEYNKDTAPHVRPSRVGLKTLVCYVDEETARLIKHLAVDKGLTTQRLGEEAYADLIKKYGVKKYEAQPIKATTGGKRAVSKSVQ